MCAFSMKTTSVFHRFSVDNRRKRIKNNPFSNENALAWMGPQFGERGKTMMMNGLVKLNSKLVRCWYQTRSTFVPFAISSLDCKCTSK